MDPVELGHQGLLAAETGALEDAIMLFTTGIQLTPAGRPKLVGKLLKDRADCHWGLQHQEEACADMKKALEVSPGIKDQAEKWFTRGFEALEQENFSVAVQCLSFSLLYCPAKNTTLQSPAYAWRAEANYRMGKIAEAQEDIARSKKADAALSKQQGRRNKEQGIQLYEAQSFKKAIVSFGLAKEFTPALMTEAHVQIQSYLASCHFCLRQYTQALEAGKEAYKIRPGRSQGEAKRWKERGKQLFKENRFDLLVDCYSLGINYAPTSDRELLAQLLCNRSLVHIKNKAFDLALLDAERCVKIRSSWSKAHYRLGSSLTGMKRYDEAMDSFASALELGETDEEKYDTLLQIITIGSEVEDGTAIIGEELCPQHIIQRAVDDAVTKENWEKLRVLFLGGGGPYLACPGEGGLASECDASRVPLDHVISSQVKDKFGLVTALLDSGACVNGLVFCKQPPLLAALEKGEFDIVTNLIQKGANMGCISNQSYLRTKEHALYWKKQADKLLRYENYNKASEYYKLATEHCPEQAADLKRDSYESLSDICFKQGKFLQCVEYGAKALSVKPVKKEEFVQKWRERGNQLFKDKEYELVIKYYSLAMSYVPQTGVENNKMSAVLLSNRCAAYLNLEMYDKAINDAKRCIKIEPEWSKGYYRLGSCLNSLGRKSEALMYFCEGLKNAATDDDKFALTSQVINTAVDLKEGTLAITCRIPRPAAQKLIKEICAKKEWHKLHMLFLGGDSHRSYQKGRGGVATGCNAVIVPLDQIVASSVPDRDKLIAVLLDHGALANGPHGCKMPPLSVAMEMEDYAMAYLLLKHGADPSAVGCLRTGQHHRENQGQYWKDEGVKALNLRNYSRAIKLLNLSLQFPNISSDLSYLVNNHLATAYFETKQYIKAVEKGRECFKIKPTKSQVEAGKWKDRGKKLFSEKEYSVLVDYYTLSMQYAPSSNKEFVATLLSNRALAHYNMGNYQQGLTDAQSCTRFRPEWHKGFVRQGDCHACLGQNREAVRAFGEGLKRAETDEDKASVLSQIISMAVNLEDGTSSITCSVQNHILEKLIKQLTEKRSWDKLHVLYLGGGGPQRYSPGEGGLATGVDASEVPLELVFDAGEKYRVPLVVALLENGASPNGLKRRRECPLELALRAEDYPLIVTLLQYNADATCLLSKAGDTLLHEALKQMFTKGNNRFFRSLLESDLFDPDVVDGGGNCLFHLVAFGKTSKRKCSAISVLLEAGVNPTLKNKEGKMPIDLVMKKDPRARLIREAMNWHRNACKKSGDQKKKKKVLKMHEKKSVPQDSTMEPSLEGDEPEWCRMAEDEPENEEGPMRDVKIKDKKPIPATPPVRQDPLDLVRASIRERINHLCSENVLESEEGSGDSAEGRSKSETTGKERDVTSQEEGSLPQLLPDIERIEVDAEDDDLDDKEVEVNLESPFEDLPWEVDCTDQFWKALQNSKVSDVLKRRIVARIRMLAEGRWTKKLCRRLDGQSKKRNILLFEAKLTRSSRIIWELTVAFSAKCSNDPELRVQSETNVGRVYSEIIRVWDIAADRDMLMKKVESIVKSHDRGLGCIVKKELSGFRKGDNKVKNASGERLPNFFVEVAERVDQFPLGKPTKCGKSVAKGSGSQFFFPPASPNDMEFHILKFYAFSSALINTVLHSDHSSRVDFPFRVTELEHAIINLRPAQPCPIILLGRSGTGKTTCCLYRLWNEFQSYWEKAATAGPHLPKAVQYLPRTERCGRFAVFEQPVELLVDSSRATVRENVDAVLETPSEEFVRARDARRQDYEEGDDTVEPSEFEDHGSVEYEHLHQVFITKNPVLCTEVQKNFCELSHACPAAREHVEREDTPLPPKIQDIDDAAWPLFITSRDWLLMLDASLPGCEFFPRADDGSLMRKIHGWGEEETHLMIIDEDSDSDDDGMDEADDHDETDDVVSGRQDPKNFDPRREVTYTVFVSDLWPKMIKKVKAQYHPTLVWTEIRSFIKGSIEALHTECGYLSLEEYSDLGRKRAPNFSADRDVVYSLFHVYQQAKCSLRMFDEADVVHQIYSRLLKVQVPDWSIHRFYVDETQDFTQAELLLLIRCSRDPNGLFFTGDTAQSIMRGIAFRFNDLKSLFFYSQQSYQALGLQTGVQVPNRLYQLTHNYRSHAGILRLASSIVDLLLYYFPESFDRLEKDQGLFEGPKPVLLESCSFGDLAMILRGNRRQFSRIEFGAHQVILVASEESRAQMPEELKQGLVLTIYESKGLEFDDVLIYNFFKDSQAKKEWRVVTTYIKEMADGKVPNTTGLIELRDEDLVISSRPLEFDPDKHKVLNSEFKFLYTAITRARVNVWFFDEDDDARAPVFEYFQKLNLVRVLRMSNEANETDQLTSMFVEKSSEEEWSKQGHYFYNRELWEVAVKCFTMAHDDLMIKKSQAQLQAAEATKLKANPKVMRAQFLKAADEFLQCAMLVETAKCLFNARERLLLAKLNMKLGKFEDAAKLLKKERHFLEASECYEMINNYHQAVEVLCQGNLYEEAIDTLQRYKSLVGVETSKGGIRPPKETRTVERLCHQLAEEHFSCGRLEEMVSVLLRLPSANDRILFLENHGCIHEAVKALIDEGRYADAGNLLRKNGRFIEAAKFVQWKKFAAECYLSAARIAGGRNVTPETFELIEGPGLTALELFKDCGNDTGQAECLLLLAKLNEDAEDAESARVIFTKANNICGAVDACLALFTITNGDMSGHCHFPGVFIKGLERLFSLVVALNKTQRNVAELQRVEMCETYFGLQKGDQADAACALVNSGCLFVSCVPYSQTEVRGNKLVLDVVVARRRLSNYLCGLALELTRNINESLSITLNRHEICRRFLLGMKCSHFGRCGLVHGPFLREEFGKRFDTLCHQIHVNALVQSFVAAMSRIDSQGQFFRRLLTSEIRDFKACRQFYDLIFPRMGLHVSCLDKGLVRSLRRQSLIKERLSRYAEFLWQSCRGTYRWQSSDLLIEISRVLHLVGEHKGISFMMSAEEKVYTEGGVSCFAMLRDEQHGGFRIFFRLMEDSERALHKYGHILGSAFMVRRFMSLVASWSSIPLLSFANTCSIFEQQIINCLALFVRLFNDRENPVCLPESYLGLIDIWDAVYGTAKFPSLFDIVENSATGIPSFKGIRDVQLLLESMVLLFSGKINRRFNLISGAFNPNALERVQCGETERVLVLVMTMLCNSGRGIAPVCGHLVDELRCVEVHSFLPCRIQEALAELQRAQSGRDVVLALQSYLSKRNERLFAVRWHNHRLWTDDINTASFTHLFSAGASMNQTDTATASEPSEGVYSPSEFQMPFEYLEEQRRERALETEREMAAVTIQRWFRRNKESRSTYEQPVHSGEAHFERFKVDISACSVCGVQFSGKSSETYESHLQSRSAHWQVLEQFKMYKELHLQKIWPLFVAGEELQDKLNALSGQDRLSSHDFGLDVQRLEYAGARVGECIRDIESRCRWCDTGLLMREVEAMEITIQQVQNIVHQDMQTVRETGDEAKADGQDVDDDYAEDEDIVDVHMSKGGVAKGGGRSKGKKKNRGGRARDKPSRVRQS